MTAPTEATSPIKANTSPDTDTAVKDTADRADLVSDEFKRGARAAAESMRFYFLDENEGSIYAGLSTATLESYEADAITGTIYDEGMRIANGRPIV